MRLPRPNIPLEIKLLVVMRQLGDFDADGFVASAKEQRMLGDAFNIKKAELAELLGCEPSDLRLDHDPALENRRRICNHRGEFVRYVPDANDPEYLKYRTAHSHHIKTNVRGDGAQFADNVIAKRERRRQKKKTRRKPEWPEGKFRVQLRWPKRKLQSRGFDNGKRKMDRRDSFKSAT